MARVSDFAWWLDYKRRGGRVYVYLRWRWRGRMPSVYVSTEEAYTVSKLMIALDKMSRRINN